MGIGQRKTEQRENIINVIEESPGPISVNGILEALKKKDLNIGIATIYRTIKLLLESEQIRQVTLPDGKARYERSELTHHHHFH